MRKMTILIMIFALTLKTFAPELRTIVIANAPKDQPYQAIWDAVCAVESAGNSLAYNSKENAIGIAQIRAIRIKDYNQRTGNDYSHQEMYDQEKAKIVFMYYALQYSPNQRERICREWNGGYKGMSKAQTKAYWNKVKSLL